MRPDQVQKAIADDLPLLLPAGCVECHGWHGPLGTDTIVVEELCRAIAERLPVVIAPTIDYGPTGWAVSGPELGTMDMDGNVFYGYVKEVLRSFLLMGWRRIFVIIHHQGMDGPEALAFRKAATELAFELMRQERGLGWWGKTPPEQHGNVWARIRVMPSVLPEAQKICRGDHAAHFETSLMLYLCPEGVDLTKAQAPTFWYAEQHGHARPAREATREDGERFFAVMVDAWINFLRQDATRMV